MNRIGIVLFILSISFNYGLSETTETAAPVDYVKFLTKYSSVIMRNLENHINATEGYLEENRNFVEFATTVLNSLSKSVTTISRNVGIGDVPMQDFRETLTELSKLVNDVHSEQRRQREATQLLSMKVDLVLQTLVTQKGTTAVVKPVEERKKEQDDGSKQILSDLDKYQKQNSASLKNLKQELISKLLAKEETVIRLTNKFDNFTLESDNIITEIRKSIKHIKDITNDNFIILRNQLNKQQECPTAQPETKIYHKPEPEKETAAPVLEKEVKEPSTEVLDAATPKIESATSFINIDLLKDFEARILISGSPQPVVTWSSAPTCNSKVETPITSGGRYTTGLKTMAPNLFAANLKITTFRHEDANLCYFITANNSAGTVSSTVILAPRSHLQDCPGSYQKVDNLCLDLISIWSPLEVSKAECEALGGALIQPTSIEQLFSMLHTWPTIMKAEKNQKLWIGVRKSHTNDWRLLNGTELVIPQEMWAKNEPDESGECLMIDIGVTEWRVWDAPCDSQRQAICQMT